MALAATYRIVPIESLRDHEEVIEPRVAELVERIRKDGAVYVPIVADAKTLVVIDGHHRLNALRRLGAKRAPVHLVDYHDSSIRVDTWRDGETPPSKDEVIRRALAGELFKPKSTRHSVIYGLPEVRVPFADLQ